LLLKILLPLDAAGATHERCGGEKFRFLLHAKKIFFL
jgi:hypothetical protein